MPRKKSTKFQADNEQIKALFEEALGRPLWLETAVTGLARLGIAKDRPIWTAWISQQGRGRHIAICDAHDDQRRTTLVSTRKVKSDLVPALRRIMMESLQRAQREMANLVEQQRETTGDVWAIFGGDAHS
jgi:hypothetical protein